MSNLNQLANQYHQALPGIVRATLLDYGVSSEVIDRYRIGWDGDAITVPIRSKSGRVEFFEAWDPEDVGVPLDDPGSVELFGRQALFSTPDMVVAEGVHEALVFESQGLPAVAATGSGRFFKGREWGGSFSTVAEVLLTYKAGDHTPRQRHLPSRQRVRDKARTALPHAQEIVWPSDFKRDQGALEFFVARGGTREEFLALARLPAGQARQ